MFGLSAILVTVSLICLGSPDAFCQVGIGTTVPHPSAALEINSHARGFLPPRLTNSQMVGLVMPAAGLLVYNTDQHELFNYNGTDAAWQPVNNGWRLGGNSIPNPATHWLGTTNTQPLVLGTAGTPRMRITPTGNVGIGTTNPQALLHVSGSLRVGANGTNVNNNILAVQVNLTFLLALGGNHSQVVSVPGAQIGDLVLATKDDGNANFIVQAARVSSNNNVEITMRNLSGLSITTTETINLWVVRP